MAKMSIMAFTEPVPLPAIPSALRASGGGKPLVLLVEDHRVNQALGKALLEVLGCEVDIAHNGSEAIMAACSRGYNLVLMDIVMPVMGGVEATRRLRAMGVTVPILALTATPEGSDGLLKLSLPIAFPSLPRRA